ncbi:hypothetical protein [Saccharopolyspora taberi]|uniref:hypothetical protein n=1 Tax=Saccharopolyspora taberi TaxID=60895 RepID=UPI0031E2AB27
MTFELLHRLARLWDVLEKTPAVSLSVFALPVWSAVVAGREFLHLPGCQLIGWDIGELGLLLEIRDVLRRDEDVLLRVLQRFDRNRAKSTTARPTSACARDARASVPVSGSRRPAFRSPASSTRT